VPPTLTSESVQNLLKGDGLSPINSFGLHIKDYRRKHGTVAVIAGAGVDENCGPVGVRSIAFVYVSEDVVCRFHPFL
jgi:hypothetical protein